jgi:prolyl 4-hydroxylase
LHAPSRAPAPATLLRAAFTGLRRVNIDPPVYVVDNFLTEDECANLIDTAGPLLQRSKTHAAAGSEATKGRTSLTCHLPKTTFPCPMLLKKIQLLTGKPYGHMELPQVARYASSQRYVEHYDGVDPHTPAGRAFCASGGQRVATVLMYLNEVEEGGATRFKCAQSPPANSMYSPPRPSPIVRSLAPH